MADNQYGEARHFDFDSGGGTDLVEVTGLVFAASGGAIAVTGFDLTNSKPVATAIVDATGNQITSFGGGTQYQEDSALGAVGSATGTLAVGRAAASVPSSVSADADAVGLWALRNGILNVRMVDNTGTPLSPGGAGSQYVEDVALGAAATGTLAIARRDDALATLSEVEGDAVGVRVGDRGALWVQIADGSGAQVTSFTGTEYTEDAAVGTGDGGLMVGKASTAVPTAMSADGDAVGIWANREGAVVPVQAPHVGLDGTPWTLTSETAQYTTTQTSTDLVTAAAGEILVITKVQIQAGGTTAGTMQLYFGTGAYSRGTNLAIFDGEFAPSATLKPGVVMEGPFIAGTAADDLKVTTSAAINPLTVTVWYYKVS